MGKSNDLAERVPQHFRDARSDVRKRAMVRATGDIQTIVLSTDREALSVEYDLIKEHRPRYNIVYRDDKSYPYIKVTTNETYPRVEVTREHRLEDASYFGPYTDVTSMRRTLEALRDIFPYRSCAHDLPAGGDSDKYNTCLDYDIKQCEGPCVGLQSKAEYTEMIENLCRFLRGKYGPVRNYLKDEMERHAANKNFEAAAVYRDRLEALENMTKRSSFINSTSNADVLGLGTKEDVSAVVLFQIRENRIINRLEFPGQSGDIDDSQALQDFILTYYPAATSIPQVILLPTILPDSALVGEKLLETAGRRIKLKVPERGEKRKLVESAKRTAKLAAENEALARKRREGDVLLTVKEMLDLPWLPEIVEAYDVSTHQGKETVAAMVRFVNGEPDKAGYRRFKISRENSADDYRSLREALQRRYRRLTEEEEQFPSLVFVDGGPGQLGVGRAVMDNFNPQLPVVSLAKREEIIYVNKPENVYNLPEDSRALQFFQRLRDEAHRFAVSYHRDRRQMVISSGLREIKGIGEKRLKQLLKTFGSPARVRQASLEELITVKGITPEIARRIKKEG